MAISVTIVGIRDKQLEETLRADGVQPTTIAPGSLGTLTHPSAVPPDVVILDLRTDPRVPAELAGLKRQHPSLGLAILVSTFDQALMVEAMRAGVTECIAGTDPRELEGAIARLTEQKAAPTAGEVFVFIGAKGGVGTTTAAVNVAASLARLASTLFIDLHATGGEAALLLAAEPRFSVFDALENTHRLDAAYFRGLVVRTKSDVDLLGASDRDLIRTVDGGHLRTLLDFAGRHYRYTVVDATRSDATVLDALDDATALVLVVNQELATVRAAARLAMVLRQRYGREKVRVVLNRVDSLSDIRRVDVEKAIDTRIAHEFPSDYRLAVDAMNRGRPLVLDKRSALAMAFRTCARDLAGVGPDHKSAVRSGGLFGLLAGTKSSSRKV